MAVTDLGPDDAWLDDVDAMVREGITSFKIFMAYPNVLMVDDRTIYKLMERTKQLGALVCVHAENGTVIDAIVQEALAAGNTGPLYHALTRPTVAEAEAVHRVVALSELAGGAKVYIVHVSCEEAMREVEAARERGLPVMGETCTQYLVLSIEDDMGKPGFEDAKYVFTPPLREKKNQAAAVGGAEGRCAAGGFDRPLPVPVCGSEDAGAGELHEDSEWRPGDREPDAAGRIITA